MVDAKFNSNAGGGKQKGSDPFLGSPLIAVDIGNARIKFGLFDEACVKSEKGVPAPLRTLPLLGNAPDFAQLYPWLAEGARREVPWLIASVNRPAASRLIDWLKRHRPGDQITLLAAGDLPLEVRLPRPDMVGIDRLVDAVAVNRLRQPDRPAVIVDVGTAITVDLVSADGAFLGGAILPGIEMSARALNHFTDLLPLAEMSELDEPPAAAGQATDEAIRAGLFWGALGAVRELIARQCESLGGNASPQVFLTGGAGKIVATLLGPNCRHEPNLTLAGIALGFRR